MTDLSDANHQPMAARTELDPALRAFIPPEYTEEQIEAASRGPSLESIFAAHLRLLALQDSEWHAPR